MANRLQRIMMMDQMFQNRSMPQSGVQSVFNPTTGTFVNVPFQTDPNFKGRRTVMTPSGPQVLPGFQGQENPYRQLGRTARNLLGNLFDRGLLRREKRKAQKQVMEQADPMLDTMYPSVVERPEFEPVPDNQARIDELQERINRPIVTSQNLPTFDISQMSRGQVKYGDPKTFTLPNGDLAVSRTVTRGNQSGLEIIDPSSGRVIFSNAPGTTSSETSSATPQANLFAKKMDREIDFDAAVLLPKDEQEKYLDPNISDAEFERLNKKAKVLLAKTPKKEKPTEGMLNSKTAFAQMSLATPTFKTLESKPELMKKLSGFSGVLAKNFRSTADPDERLYLQAADIWIRAKLRKESGAVIGDDEMTKEYAAFFPQLNDTPEMLAEKARQREVLTRQMGINAGEIKETKQDKEQIPEAQKEFDFSNAVTITTQKEFDALPSGTPYIDGKNGFQGFKK